ncbi:MAG: HU family DNA-binding protein [Actinomycetota bacterium]
MKRAELAAELSRRTGMTRVDADHALHALLEAITDELRGGGEITLTGFGKFTTQERAGRTGVNPRDTSQKVEIPPSRVPKFTAGSALKAAVKQG